MNFISLVGYTDMAYGGFFSYIVKNLSEIVYLSFLFDGYKPSMEAKIENAR